MSESKRIPKQVKAKKVFYFTGKLQCQRDGLEWNVVDLNTERKVVECPVCGETNDIREARARANGEFVKTEAA